METYLDAMQRGLGNLVATDERVHILGADLLDPYGGAFKVTEGLQAAFPDRVLTTPVSEAGVTGVGVGMALRGLRPIIEVMFGDFVTLIADQLINYAAKFSAMYPGTEVPLVVRTPMGGGRGYGPTHSQSLERLMFGVPHLRIVAPSIFHDPGALIQHATLTDPGVVLFLEHKMLYSAPLMIAGDAALTVETRPRPDGYPTRLVRNYRSGRPDVTVVCYGGASLLLERALGRMAAEEIKVLACVPALVQPLPGDDLVAAATASGRVVVVEEGPRPFGWGAEVAAHLTTAAWNRLEAPVSRVGALDTVIPAARGLESQVLPSAERLEAAILGVLE